MPQGTCSLVTYDERVVDKLQPQSKTEQEVWIADQPFGSGGCRQAFHCYLMKDGKTTSKKLVAKRYIRDEGFAEDYVCSQMGNEVAKAFNAHCPYKKVQYLIPNRIITMGRENYSLEDFLEGHWEKHNDIFGNILSNKRTPGAFSHFSWVHSKNKYVILDVQGVGESYTDPAVVSVQTRKFGYTDTGLKGIRDFFARHQCNEVCKALHLDPVGHIPDGLRFDDAPPRPIGGIKGHQPQYHFLHSVPAGGRQQGGQRRPQHIHTTSEGGAARYVNQPTTPSTAPTTTQYRYTTTTRGGVGVVTTPTSAPTGGHNAHHRAASHQRSRSQDTMPQQEGVRREEIEVFCFLRGKNAHEIQEICTASVFQLKNMLTKANIDFTNCVEKKELLLKFVQFKYPTSNITEGDIVKLVDAINKAKSASSAGKTGAGIKSRTSTVHQQSSAGGTGGSTTGGGYHSHATPQYASDKTATHNKATTSSHIAKAGGSQASHNSNATAKSTATANSGTSSGGAGSALNNNRINKDRSSTPQLQKDTTRTTTTTASTVKQQLNTTCTPAQPPGKQPVHIDRTESGNSEVSGSPTNSTTSSQNIKLCPWRTSSPEPQGGLLDLPHPEEVDKLAVRQLKLHLFHLNEPFDDCVEKPELANKLKMAILEYKRKKATPATAFGQRHRSASPKPDPGKGGSESTPASSNSSTSSHTNSPRNDDNKKWNSTVESVYTQNSAISTTNNGSTEPDSRNSQNGRSPTPAQQKGSPQTGTSYNTRTGTPQPGNEANGEHGPTVVAAAPKPSEETMSPKTRLLYQKLLDMNIMNKKTMFFKYGKNKNPHRRHLQINLQWDPKKNLHVLYLCWQDVATHNPKQQGDTPAPQRKPEELRRRPLDGLKEVHLTSDGQKFQAHIEGDEIRGRKNLKFSKSLCFTLIFNSCFLDLLAPKEEEFTRWTQALITVAEANRDHFSIAPYN